MIFQRETEYMIKIDKDACVGCGACVKDCVTGYLSIEEPAHKAAVTGDRCIRCGHCEAICPIGAIEEASPIYTAYNGFDIDDAHIEADEIEAYMAMRRSVRHFSDKPVEREKLERLIEAARFSPTSSNGQTLGFIVYDDTKDEVKRLAAECLTDDVMDAMSSHVNRSVLERIVDTYAKGEDRLFFGAPAVILITDTRGNGVDAGIAATRIELLAEAMGLGVLINAIFPIITDNCEGFSQSIGVPKGAKALISLCIGYPTVSFMRPPKRKKANVIWR